MWTRVKKINDDGEVSYTKTNLLKPFIVHSINGESMDISGWHFDIGYHFREAIGLKYCTRVKTTTTNGVKKKKRWNAWMQSPILSFHEGDTLHHRSGESLIQIEEGLPSGFEQEHIEHGKVRISRYLFNNITKSWTKKDRFSGDQLDLLLVAILGYDYLERMSPLFLNTELFSSDKGLKPSPAETKLKESTPKKVIEPSTTKIIFDGKTTLDDTKISNFEFDF